MVGVLVCRWSGQLGDLQFNCPPPGTIRKKPSTVDLQFPPIVSRRAAIKPLRTQACSKPSRFLTTEAP
ncbi:hypothetical protein SKAU_G00152400 [Synaphobranchus kaupii]|uniref:Uncharacterized protein n=1 Tax=Synaphobranchus kaupii TaxID=118154 RepID=A0A9Q1FHG0_SYNKA|nr:hypothetical protein SKAU_G00152400 [Synaphobranchus kaupii]